MKDPIPDGLGYPETFDELWACGKADYRAGYPPTWTPNLGPCLCDWSFSLWLGGWEHARWLHRMKKEASLGVAIVAALEEGPVQGPIENPDPPSS